MVSNEKAKRREKQHEPRQESKEDHDALEEGWRDQYWRKMEAEFGLSFGDGGTSLEDILIFFTVKDGHVLV